MTQSDQQKIHTRVKRAVNKTSIVILTLSGTEQDVIYVIDAYTLVVTYQKHVEQGTN